MPDPYPDATTVATLLPTAEGRYPRLTVARPAGQASRPSTAGIPLMSIQPSADLGELVRPLPGQSPTGEPLVGSETAAPAADLAIPKWLLSFGTRPLVGAADLIAVTAAAFFVRLPSLQLALFGVTAVFVFWALGLYRSRLSISVLDEVPRLACGLLGATALSLGLFLLVRGSDHDVDLRLVWMTGAAFMCAVAGRTVSYSVIRKLRMRGIRHRTLIVGAGRVGTSVVDLLNQHPEYGLKPIGFVDTNPLRHVAEYDPPILGDHASLPSVLKEFSVRAVVIAFSQAREESMIEVIRECDRMRCDIFVVPRLFEVHHVSSDMDYAWSMPLSRLRRGSNRPASRRVKRIFDICSSAFALIILSPLMFLIAGAVRLEGGPDVLFKQVRVGLDGTYFELLKFRSLRPVDETESATNWNISYDDRLGRVGRFLRKTSLDELPQLFNILRGDMSVVGPRPERPHFVAQFGMLYPHYIARHRVPCGLTGWAQIHGLRGDTSIEDRARFDNYYVENWCLWLDVKIVLRTMTSIIKRAGS